MTAALKPEGDLRGKIPNRQAGSHIIGLSIFVNIPKIRQPHCRLKELNQANRETRERLKILESLLLPEFRLIGQPSNTTKRKTWMHQ